MLKGRSLAELQRDYLAALERGRDLGNDLGETLRAYEGFVRKHSHALAARPEMLLPLAHAQPLDSPVLADARRKFNGGPAGPWLRLLNPPETDQNPALVRTIIAGFRLYSLAYLEIDRVPHALSGGDDGALYLWNLANGQRVRRFEGHTANVWAVAVTADGRRAISGSNDKTLRVWDLGSGQCLQTLRGHTGVVGAVALAADGLAVLGSEGRTLRVWDLGTGQCLALFPCEAGVNAIAVSPDCPPIVVAGLTDGQVQFFRLEGV
jgi:WD40 repeat protein